MNQFASSTLVLFTDVTQNAKNIAMTFAKGIPFGTSRGFKISPKTGLFPKGWLFAEPKTIRNVAKSRWCFILFVHHVNVVAIN